jgi:hypothetical protein
MNRMEKRSFFWNKIALENLNELKYDLGYASSLYSLKIYVNIIYVKNGILSFNGSHNLTFNSNSRGTPLLVVLSSQK